MSTVIYSKGRLITDSSLVTSTYNKVVYAPTLGKKLFLSKKRYVVFGISGELSDTNDMQDIADILETTLLEHKCLSLQNEDMLSCLKLLLINQTSGVSFIVMTSIKYHIYCIRLTIEDNEQHLSISQIDYNSHYTIGSGCFIAHAALASGYDIYEALRQTIKYDYSTKGPIMSLDITNLTAYTDEEVV